MTKFFRAGQTAALLTTLAIVTGDFAIPVSVFAQDVDTLAQSSENSVLIAQGLIGQCRAAKRDIFIYSERSTTSTRLRGLPANAQVTLADNGAAGWIAVNAPATGFVQAADLKLCSGTGQPPTSNLCRQLSVALNVRATPSETGNYITTLNAGQRVTLRTAEERVVAGRSWVEITAPNAGWISSGVGNSRNIVNCPGTGTPTTGRACRVTAPIGLRTHQSPGGAAIPPGVGFNETVTITGERRVIGDRVWLQITRPVNAWVSSGFVNNENNLTPNPCR